MNFKKTLLFIAILLASSHLFVRTVYASTTISLASSPLYPVVSGTKIYISGFSGANTVTVIDSVTDTVVATIPVGATPSYMEAVSGKVYVSNILGNVSVINTATDTVVNTISLGGPTGTYTQRLVGAKLYIDNEGSDSVSVIDTRTDTVTATIPVGSIPIRDTVFGTKLYVNNQHSNTVSVIDTSTDTVTTTISVGSYPSGGVVVGTKLYVNNAHSNSLSVINTATDTVVNTISVGTGEAHYPTVIGTKLYVTNNQATLSIIDTLTDTVSATKSVGLDPTFSTVIGNKLYLDNSNSSIVTVIDSTTDVMTDIISTGVGPYYNVAVGNKLYVLNVTSNTVTVIDTTKIPSQLPDLVSFSSSTSNGTYTSGQSINITANFGLPIHSGSTMTVALNSGGTATLSTVSGSTLSGTYVVGSEDVTPDLAVMSISSASVTDSTSTYTRTSYALPLSQGSFTGENSFITRNLGDNKNIVIGSYSNILVGDNPYQISAPVTVSSVDYSYVANQGDNTVSVIRLSDNTVVDTIAVGSEPYGLTVATVGSTKFIYVANILSNNVSVIDTSTNTVVATISVGTHPYYVEHIGTNVYVTNGASNTVSVIDANSNTVTATISVGSYPRGIKAHGTDLYVANFGDPNYSGGNYISVIDSNTNTVTNAISLPVGSNGPRGVTVLGSKVYVANFRSNNVSVINTATNTVTATISVGVGPRGIIGLGTTLYVENFDDGTISVINTSNNTVTKTIPVGSSPAGMMVSGTNIYLTSFQDNKVYIIDTTTNELVTFSTLDHFTFTTIGNQTSTVPFSVTISAKDSSGVTVGSFEGTVNLSTTDTSITPTTSNSFSNGTVTQNVTLTGVNTARTITAVKTGSSETGTSNTFNVVADTTPPNTSIDTNSLAISSGGSTDTVDVTFTFSGTDDAGVDHFECKLDSGSFSTCTSPQDYSSLSVGAHAFQVRAVDINNNTDASPAEFDWTIFGSLDHFTFDTISTQVDGASFSITITAKDASENTVTSFTDTVDLSTTDTSITPTTSSNFADGVLTESVTVAGIAPDRTITATYTGNSETGTSNGFDVQSSICQAIDSGNWSDSAIWIGCTGVGGIPDISDNVTITADITVTLDDMVSIQKLIIQGTLDTDMNASYQVVSAAIDLQSGGIFNANGSVIILTGTGEGDTLFAFNGGTFNEGSATVNMTADESFLFITSGIANFYSLVLSPSITEDDVYVFGSDVTIQTYLVINPDDVSHTLTVGTLGALTVDILQSDNGIYIGPTGGALVVFDTTGSPLTSSLLYLGENTTFYSNDSSIILNDINGDTPIISISAGGFFSRDSSTVTISSDSDVILNDGTLQLNDLTLEGLGKKTLGFSLIIRGTLTVSAGEFDTNGSRLGGFTTAILNVEGGATIDITGDSFGFDYFAFDSVMLAPTSIVNYSADTDQTIDNTLTYGNLLVSGDGTKSPDGVLSVGNVLRVLPPAIFDTDGFDIGITYLLNDGTINANDSTITLTDGGWSSSGGTFNSDTSTVIFTGDADATITGETSFNNLTITNPNAKLIQFDSSGSTVDVTGAFSAIGTSGNVLSLHSDSDGTKWHFHPTGTATVSYAHIQDGGCEAGAIFINPTNSTNGENNDSCWLFDSALDTTPPVTSITSSNPSSTTTTSISLTFSGTDDAGVDHFECNLDNAGFSSCVSPKSYSSLNAGAHIFKVRAVDTSDNVDASPAEFDWTITTASSNGCSGGCAVSPGGNPPVVIVPPSLPPVVLPPITPVPPPPPSCPLGYLFDPVTGKSCITPLIQSSKLLTVNMKQGVTSDQVRTLQTFLKAQGPSIYPEGLVTGYFGPLTTKAVIRFQDKYYKDILEPQGIKHGTGWVWNYTRKEINKVIGGN